MSRPPEPEKGQRLGLRGKDRKASTGQPRDRLASAALGAATQISERETKAGFGDRRPAAPADAGSTETVN